MDALKKCGLCKKSFYEDFKFCPYCGGGLSKQILRIDDGLYKRLKEFRLEKATGSKIPPYCIFTNAALEGLASQRPESLQELSFVKGIGPKLIDKYGVDLLKIIKENKGESGVKQVQVFEPDTITKTFYLFRNGKCIADICATRKLKQETVYEHFAYLVHEGFVKPQEIISADKRKKIMDKIKDGNLTYLKEIKNKLGDDISYGELKCMIMFLKRHPDFFKDVSASRISQIMQNVSCFLEGIDENSCDNRYFKERNTVDSKNSSNYHERLGKVKAKFPNAYKPWSSDVEQKLRELFLAGKSIPELCAILQRQPGGIRSRLKKLNLHK